MTLQRKLAAVLAADVVGYTRLMELSEEETHGRLMRLFSSVLQPAIARHRGQLVKNTGDGMLVTFGTARDATACALEVQRAVAAAEDEEAVDHRINFRIGINLADVIVEDHDIYGDGVNIAARLQTYAEPGGVVVSGAVVEQIGDEFGVGAVDLGEIFMRNLVRPVRVFRLRMDDLPMAAVGNAPPGFEARPSIAVLPFRKRQTDPEEAYFVDGIVDEIIHALASLKELFVISRASTLAYGGGAIDVRSIGRELGVRYLLYGSVRRAGGKLRIRTELSDAEAGTITRSDRYEGEEADLFRLQDRIAKRVVTTIAPHVRERELARALRKHPENMTAYDFVLQALEPLYRMDYESFSRARGLLQLAMTHDPAYAPAYSYAAYWHMIRVGQGWSQDGASDAGEAARLAAAAIERDGNDALALAIYGHVHSFLLKDFDEAVRLLDRAIEAGPSSDMAWSMSSLTCGYLGDGATAVLRAEHGLSLSPAGPQLNWHEHALSQAHYVNGNYDEAVAWGRRSMRHNARLTSNLRTLAASLVAVGKVKEARQVARAMLEIERGFRLGGFAARTPMGAGKGVVLETFVERLRLAGLPD